MKGGFLLGFESMILEVQEPTYQTHFRTQNWTQACILGLRIGDRFLEQETLKLYMKVMPALLPLYYSYFGLGPWCRLLGSTIVLSTNQIIQSRSFLGLGTSVNPPIFYAKIYPIRPRKTHEMIWEAYQIIGDQRFVGFCKGLPQRLGVLERMPRSGTKRSFDPHVSILIMYLLLDSYHQTIVAVHFHFPLSQVTDSITNELVCSILVAFVGTSKAIDVQLINVNYGSEGSLCTLPKGL